MTIVSELCGLEKSSCHLKLTIMDQSNPTAHRMMPNKEAIMKEGLQKDARQKHKNGDVSYPLDNSLR